MTIAIATLAALTLNAAPTADAPSLDAARATHEATVEVAQLEAEAMRSNHRHLASTHHDARVRAVDVVIALPTAAPALQIVRPALPKRAPRLAMLGPEAP